MPKGLVRRAWAETAAWRSKRELAVLPTGAAIGLGLALRADVGVVSTVLIPFLGAALGGLLVPFTMFVVRLAALPYRVVMERFDGIERRLNAGEQPQRAQRAQHDLTGLKRLQTQGEMIGAARPRYDNELPAPDFEQRLSSWEVQCGQALALVPAFQSEFLAEPSYAGTAGLHLLNVRWIHRDRVLSSAIAALANE